MDGAWRCHYCDPEAGFERVPTHLLQWYQNGTVLQKMQDMSMELAARLRSAGPKLGHDNIALRNIVVLSPEVPCWLFRQRGRRLRAQVQAAAPERRKQDEDEAAPEPFSAFWL